MRAIDVWQSYKYEDHILDYEIATLSEYEKEYYEERAAIMEYDAGMTRAEAEKIACDEAKKYWRN